MRRHAIAAWPTTPTAAPASTSSRRAAATTRSCRPIRSCHPDRDLPSIYQLTLTAPPHWARFGYPGYYIGTSMSVAGGRGDGRAGDRQRGDRAPPVAGPDPRRGWSRPRCRSAAGQPNPSYGFGLLDAGAATAPLAVATHQ